MIAKSLMIIPVCLLSLACNNSSGLESHASAAASKPAVASESSAITDTAGKTIKERFRVPEGYKRAEAARGSFVAWLRELPLKKHGSRVMLYNGAEKGRQDVHAAVIDMDVGKHDLQQCADAVMRLRSEYLFSTGQHDKIHFNFTSGHRAAWLSWVEGYRPVINGNNVTFTKKAAKDGSYEAFRKYLQTVFTYAGTLSLSRELKPVRGKGNIQAGDVFIHGGLPGHAVIVVDVAVNEQTGERIFMLAQSYMPAQEIHVLRNFSSEMSPWYKENFDQELETPEWTFDPGELMRFE